MASPDEFVRHCADLLAPLGAVRVRRMFGGHGLYLDELFIAIIAEQVLYLKIDPACASQFEQAGGRRFEYEAKGRCMSLSYWTPPPEAMESAGEMAPWARLAVEAAIRARSCAVARPRRR